MSGPIIPPSSEPLPSSDAVRGLATLAREAVHWLRQLRLNWPSGTPDDLGLMAMAAALPSARAALIALYEHPLTQAPSGPQPPRLMVLRAAIERVWREAGARRQAPRPDVRSQEFPDGLPGCWMMAVERVTARSIDRLAEAGEALGDLADALETQAPRPTALPEWMTAKDLANQTGQTPDAVGAWLRRHRERSPDCYREAHPDDCRRNEARYLYRSAEVLPLLLEKLRHRRR